jgi:uncharacterized repeat protein (TIGR03803 family)
VGTLFKFTPGGNLTTLFTFCPSSPCSNGQLPLGLVEGSDGYLYGVTFYGGQTDYAYGTLYRVSSTGKFELLHTFCSLANCADGIYPSFPPIQGLDGNFYGTAAVLSNAETPAGVDDIGQHLLNTNAVLHQPPKEHKQVAVDPKVLDGYVGQYQLAPHFVMTITRDGAQLFVQATGQPKLEIFPESDRCDYFLKVVDAQITFETDSQARATGLVLHQNGMNQQAKRLP